MATIVELASLAQSRRASLFVGADHGARVSFFVTVYARGDRVEQHRHPYEEVFLVETGRALFMVDGEAIHAHAGQIVIVPAGAAHGFENREDEPLRQVSIHPAPVLETEWLE